MPMFMHFDGIEPDVTRGRDTGFATGHTLVHVEAAGHGINEMSFDDTAGGENVEVMVKILDGHPAPAPGEPPVHMESDVGWLL